MEEMDFEALEGEFKKSGQEKMKAEDAEPGSAPVGTTTGDTKRCPYCAEIIKAAAIKCRFCGEWLDGRQAKPSEIAGVSTTMGSVERGASAQDEAGKNEAPAELYGTGSEPRYLIDRGGLTEGPFSLQELQGLVDRGLLVPTNSIITPDEKVNQAGNLEGLRFDSAFNSATFQFMRHGIEYGPYALDEMKSFASGGNLSPDTVLKIGEGHFLPAKEVPKLWSSQSQIGVSKDVGALGKAQPKISPPKSQVGGKAGQAETSDGAKGVGVASVIVFFALIAVFWAINRNTCDSDSDGSSSKSISMDQRALSMCRQEVREKLKDPGSVIWGDEPSIEKDKKGYFIIFGTMRAKNSFGGYVSGTYNCRLKHKEGKTWLVTYAVPGN